MGETFWCDYEPGEFPISELRPDRNGRPIHYSSNITCHYPNGNRCDEPVPPLLAFNDRSDEEKNLLYSVLYALLPDENKRGGIGLSGEVKERLNAVLYALLPDEYKHGGIGLSDEGKERLNAVLYTLLPDEYKRGGIG
jgi:hypothetical protein